MLNYAAITLSNPARPELTINAMALVIQDETGLVISAAMQQQLQLNTSEKRKVHVSGLGEQDTPYCPSVSISYAGKTACAGALVAGNDTLIGISLARELGLLGSAPPRALSAAEPNDVVVMAPVARSDPWSLSSEESKRSLKQVMLVENFIDAQLCRFLCDYGHKQRGTKLGVVDNDKTTPDRIVSMVDTKARDTMRLPLNTGMTDLVNDLLYTAFTQHIEPFFGLQIERWENPQFLHYTKGGKYGVHADAEHWSKRPDGTGYWERSQDRDISVLLYLNDGFTGGLLDLPNQHSKIKPKPGLLVAFPSGQEFRHSAEPTESGERFVLVSWSAARGTPRVRKEVPYLSIGMDEYREKRGQQ